MPPVDLIGKDGATYQAPDDAAAQKAVASGEFALASPPAVDPPAAAETAPAPAAPPGAGAGALDAATKAALDAEAGGDQAALLASESAARAEPLPNPEEHLPSLAPVPPLALKGADGSIYEAPDPDAAAKAVASGQFAPPTPLEYQTHLDEQAGRARVEEEGGTGLKPIVGGAVDAALTAGLRRLPLVAEIAGVPGASPKDRAEDAAREDIEATQVQEDSPIAYGVGAVGGELAKAAVTGGVAGGLTKAAGLTGLGRAAAEGVIFSAEPVAQKIANKDPAGAAEALALGGGLNVGLHGIFTALEQVPALARKLGGAAGEAGDAVRSKFIPEYSKQEAQNFYGRQIGLTTKQIADSRDEFVPLLKAAKIGIEDTREQAIAKIQKLEESGPAIGRAIKELDTFDGKSSVIEEHMQNAQSELRRLIPQEALDREAVEASYESAKKELKRIALADKPNPIRLGLAKNQLETAEKALLDMPKISPLAEQALKTIGPIVEQVGAVAKKGTFAETQALKKFVGDQTNFADNKFANTLRKQAYGIVAENTARAEDAAAEQLGSAAVVEGLRQQRGAYMLYKLFGDAADKVAARAAPEQLSHLLGGPHTGSGHMLPHFVLGAFGLPSGLNAALAITGIPQLVKGYVAKQQLRGAAAKLLNESTAPASNTVVHALERQKTQIGDSARSFLSALAEGGAESKREHDMSGGLRGFVEDANGRSHKQQLAALQRTVTQAQTNPGAFADHLGTLTAPLRAEGLDKVADAYTEHQLRLMRVLQVILPKQDLLKSAHPFSAKVEADEISPATKAKYQRALTVAADPTALLGLVRTNQITAGDVALAAAVNPSTLQKLREALIDEGMKSKPDLSYQQRLSMGILLGEHLDESTQQVPVLQSVYAASAGGPGPAKPRAHLTAKSHDNLAGSSLTLSQQASGHQR